MFKTYPTRSKAANPPPRLKMEVTKVSICPSLRLSVCASVRLSVCPSLRLSVYIMQKTFTNLTKSVSKIQAKKWFKIVANIEVWRGAGSINMFQNGSMEGCCAALGGLLGHLGVGGATEEAS